MSSLRLLYVKVLFTQKFPPTKPFFVFSLLPKVWEIQSHDATLVRPEWANFTFHVTKLKRDTRREQNVYIFIYEHQSKRLSLSQFFHLGFWKECYSNICSAAFWIMGKYYSRSQLICQALKKWLCALRLTSSFYSADKTPQQLYGCEQTLARQGYVRGSEHGQHWGEGRRSGLGFWTKWKKIHPGDVATECQRWQGGAALWINHVASAALTASVTVTSKKGLRWSNRRCDDFIQMSHT